MKNVTAIMEFIHQYASSRGESMASIATDKLAELVGHLRALDRVVIAAESFVACAAASNPWTEAEVESFEYLRQTLKAVAS